jgi:hypothetical protein
MVRLARAKGERSLREGGITSSQPNLPKGASVVITPQAEKTHRGCLFLSASVASTHFFYISETSRCHQVDLTCAALGKDISLTSRWRPYAFPRFDKDFSQPSSNFLSCRIVFVAPSAWPTSVALLTEMHVSHSLFVHLDNSDILNIRRQPGGHFQSGRVLQKDSGNADKEH